MSADPLGQGGEFIAAHEAAVALRAEAEQYGEIVTLLAQASAASSAALSLATLLYVTSSATRSDLQRQVELALRALQRARAIVPELERQRNAASPVAS